MEKQVIQDHSETMDEEFPDEFRCCVCLDILYKPAVLACGHISCFWCVFKAMDTLQESRCPVCRNPYNHFPRVCGLLHFLLLKLYPQAYKRRQIQVTEEEKKRQQESPQVDDTFTDFISVNDDRGVSSSSSSFLDSVPAKPNAIWGGDHSLIQDSSQRTTNEDITSIPTTSRSQTTANEANSVGECTNMVLITKLQCAVCKQLLCRPVVLNCGHVYCETCIDLHPKDNVCKCPACQSAHPNGFPNVCLILDHFLEENFPEEYSSRKATLTQCPGSSKRPREKQEQANQSSSVPTHVYSSMFSGSGAKFHPGVGCDYCGMYPIIGQRYKCKDCVEAVGFDLCEGCHISSTKLPGRFNQQHTKDHQFEVMQPPNLRNTILRLGQNDGIRILYFPNDDGPANELEITGFLDSTGEEDPQDVENDGVPPDSLGQHSEDQQ